MPDLLQRRLLTLAELGEGGDHRLATAVRERLSRLFQRRIVTGDARREFDEAIVDVFAPLALTGALNRNLLDDANAPPTNWQQILVAYYDALNRLSQRFGLPGKVFVNSTVIDTNAAGAGRLDDHPISI